MSRPTTPSFYNVFGGVNLESGSEIGEYEARTLTNLYIHNRGEELRRRLGTALIASGFQSENDQFIDGLRWVQISGSTYIPTVVSGMVFDALSGDPSAPFGPARFTAGIDVNTAFMQNRLYLGNGTDQNIRFDGTTVRQVLPEQPSVPTLTVSGAGALVGNYYYRMTFTSADGVDSQPSDAVFISGAIGFAVELTAIDTATGSADCASRKIWRTVTDGAVFYLVGTISDNTTTVYFENTADSDVDTGVSLDLSAVRFPPCKYLATHQERLVGGYCSVSGDGDKRTLFVSNYQTPEICPLIAPLDETDDPTFGIRVPLPDDMTGLASFGNVLLCWTRGSCHRLIGDNPNNWAFDKWLDNGCVAHRTIVSSRNILLWLGPDGVYLAEGWGQLTRISDPIREELEDLSSTYMGLAHAFVWENRYYLMFPSAAYYYDLRFRTWGKLDPWLWRVSTVSQNTGAAKEQIYAAVYGEAQVWQLETGTTDEHNADGTGIQTVWESKDKDLGHFGREKRVHRVRVAFKVASGDATVSLYRSGELLDTFTHDLSTTVRTGSEISVLDDRASEGARDEYFRLKVTSETDADDYRILQAGWHYTLVT